MTVGNPASGSLFRSLGADDSYFETRARAASKEAEQRWPLFKAVTPNQAEETPELSEQQRQTAWTAPLPGTQPAAKAPRLSRPGLGQKLADGLRELSQKTKQELAAPLPTTPVQSNPARSLRSSLPAHPAAASAPATPSPIGTTPTPPPLFRPAAAADSQPGTPARLPAQPAHSQSSTLFRTPHPTGAQVVPPRKTGTPRATNATLRPAEEGPRSVQAKKGLFSQLASTPERAHTDAAPATTTPLQNVFNRLNAEIASPPAATKKRGGLFARIAR